MSGVRGGWVKYGCGLEAMSLICSFFAALFLRPFPVGVPFLGFLGACGGACWEGVGCAWLSRWCVTGGEGPISGFVTLWLILPARMCGAVGEQCLDQDRLRGGGEFGLPLFTFASVVFPVPP